MLGILVIGDNHFIVEGQKPDAAQARALARQWTIIELGGAKSPIPGWEIRNKGFREDLAWAVVVADDCDHSAAVVLLLDELTARGIHASYAQ